MVKVNRRNFIKLGSAGAVAGVASTMPYISSAKANGKGGSVVIIGGGVAGATTARYLKLANSDIDVTIVEPKASYHTCFMSNEVLGGVRSLESIEVSFDGLKAMGVNFVKDKAAGIDVENKVVTTAGGEKLSYDRCVVAPGISFVKDAVDGYDANAQEKIMHAWQAGPQTATLRAQLEAMDDGGTVAIVPPPNPFRCPPGPYERASLIAHYLKNNKPKSKIVILDTKDKFSKQGLFTNAWKELYGFGSDNSMISWIPAATAGKVNKIDASTMTVESDFETVKADVINYIPPQKAGEIALNAGLANDGGWCPVDKGTFESTIHAGVHVLGDASVAAKMPKSGYAANSQGKVCASAIAAALAGKEQPEPSYVNTCYSIAGEDFAFSVAAVYKLDKEKNEIAGVSSGLSPVDASAEDRKREVGFAYSWYANIRKDSWG